MTRASTEQTNQEFYYQINGIYVVAVDRGLWGK